MTDKESSRSEAGEAPALQIALLYEQHRRMVAALCRLLLRDPVEAEDAVQQTFLSAFASLSAGTVPRTPAPWLAAIARRECWARTAQRRRRPLPLEDAADSAVGGVDPVEEAIRSVDVDALWSAIDGLPHGQRKAFLMRELSGLSYAEAAVALGVTESAIESLLVRARRHLRDGLATTVSTANAALTPLVFLHHRLWRLLGGSPSARTGTAAAAAGLPAAVKLTATTAVVVAIASAGAGLRAPMFAGHHPTRTPLAAPRAGVLAAAPDRTAGRHDTPALHRRRPSHATVSTVRPILPQMTRTTHSSPTGHAHAPGGAPVPATAATVAAPPATPKARPADTPSVPAPTVDVTDQTDATPSASQPSATPSTEASQTETVQTDGSQTDAASTDAPTSDTAAPDATPTETAPSDTASTDGSSTDPSSSS